MGSKTEGWAGTKMQRVILLKRPTFLLYVGVESFPCAISSEVYKLQLPRSIKSSFQDKRNQTVAVLTSTMNRKFHDAPTILVPYRKGHGPPALWVPDLGGEKGHPRLLRDPGAARRSGARWRVCHPDTAPQQWGYKTAGISDETVSKGCQWQSIKAS